MPIDLQTYLVAVCRLVDEVCRPHGSPRKPALRRGWPELADSEVLTLLPGPWLGKLERVLPRNADHLRADFPCLLGQSALERRGCSPRGGRGLCALPGS